MRDDVIHREPCPLCGYPVDHLSAKEINSVPMDPAEVFAMKARLGACWALLDRLERAEHWPIDMVRRMLRAALEGNDGH